MVERNVVEKEFKIKTHGIRSVVFAFLKKSNNNYCKKIFVVFNKLFAASQIFTK